jgi:hypothetical protein
MVAGIIAGFVIGVIASLLWRRAEYHKEQRWHWASRLPVYEHRDQRAALGQMRPVAFLAAPKSKIQFNGVGGLAHPHEPTGRSSGSLVELSHVEHLGKNRYSIDHGLGHSCRFICARRRPGRNGKFRRSTTKRWSNWRGAKSDDRP